MSQPNFITQLKLSFAEFWSVRDARERKMLTIAAMVVALSLIYALLITPALTGRELLRKKLPALREQVVLMQALSKEVAGYGEHIPTMVTTMSQASITAALSRLNLKPQSVTVTGDFAQVQLIDVSFSNTLDCLKDIQKTALISVSEAYITALAQPDKVDVKITLRQHKNQ
jgi:general secretion pathway protein M